ncbi:MAG: hypothetical protein AB7Q37_10810 [Pyrinomonadaceae bacterium]
MALNAHSVKLTVRPRIKRLAGREQVYPLAAIGLIAAGFLAPLLGLFLFILKSIIGDAPRLRAVGTVLTIVGIPLLLAGSHLMDLFDRMEAERDKGPEPKDDQFYE